MDNTIKTKAKELFSEQNYSEAIDTLIELGINGFVAFAQKVNKREKKDNWFRDINFYRELVKRNVLFQQLFKSGKADELLFDYFNYTDYLPVFEQKLAKDFPELFVKSIQLNHSFLVPERLELYSKLQIPDNLKVHFVIWKHLQRIESEIWKNVESGLNQLFAAHSIKLDDVLIELIIWFEEFRFQKTTQKDLLHLSSIYNTLIPLLQFHFQKSDIEFSINSNFQENFLKTLKHRPIRANLNFLLSEISNWINFKDSVLFPYCYDSTIKPTKEKGIIYFNRTSQNYYKWELDGCRYPLNRLSYFFKGIDCVEYLINKGEIKIPKGNQPNDENGNYQLAVQDWQIRTFLDDLKISKFAFNGKKIPVQSLYMPLIAYSKNKNIRYEQGLQIENKRSQNWVEAFFKLNLKSLRDNIERLPFFLMSEQEYIALNNSAIKELPENSSQDIANLFSYQVKEVKKFNRYNKNYDVWNKPFLKIGEYLFCPIMFLANNDWFYAFAQAGLDNLNKPNASNERKTTATEMEIHLGQLFEKENWKVKVFNDKEANLIKGDVDIAINDENTTLLIQLKRTKFRLDLKEAHFENINTDRKASQQLNDAEKYLDSNAELFKLNKTTIKWIVTTSFENVLLDIDGCLKVNYFDLLKALNIPEINTLQDLITYCKNEKALQSWFNILQNPEMPNEIKYGILESGLPLPLVEPKFYNQPLFADNDFSIEYHNQYNKALEHGEKGEKEKAIKILEVCASENPNDYEVWGALGNYYADVKKFPKSFLCFEKALKIIPNDPYILRNYALAHRDSEDLKKCEEIYKKIFKDYWFVDLR